MNAQVKIQAHHLLFLQSFEGRLLRKLAFAASRFFGHGAVQVRRHNHKITFAVLRYHLQALVVQCRQVALEVEQRAAQAPLFVTVALQRLHIRTGHDQSKSQPLSHHQIDLEENGCSGNTTETRQALDAHLNECLPLTQDSGSCSVKNVSISGWQRRSIHLQTESKNYYCGSPG